LSTGKEIRIKRIRGADGRILMVALDHAAVAGPMDNLADPRRVLEAVVEGEPDSLLLTRGMLRHAGDVIPSHVGVVMRISGGFTVLQGGMEFRDRIISSVEEALRWGADGVAVTIKYGHEMEGEFIQAASMVADACDRWGVPLLVEAMVALRGGAGLSEDEALAVAARAAAEIGADLIKVAYPVKEGDIRPVVEGCPVPVLVLGGEKGEDEKVLAMVEKALEEGAAGVAMGRNVWQRKDPASFLDRLRAVMGRSTVGDESG
jgi:DhnA family fructose-bisphosphate aldolase class Ia